MFRQIITLSFSLLSLISLTSASVASRWKYLGPALDAAAVMNDEWYDPETGRWQRRWWNSGSITTTLADLVSINTDALLPWYNYYFENTYRVAPKPQGSSFRNEFYDDEGWWALAWIKVHDLTSNKTYLETAEDLFEDMNTAKTASCGGLWWKKDRKENNSITNALYLQVAAALAERVPSESKSKTYCAQAIEHAEWFLSSGLINAENTVADSLSVETCLPAGPNFSYNNGATIAGLVEIYLHLGEIKYLDTATRIAHGVLQTLTDGHGILVEHTYPDDMDPNSAQFKGVFARSLAALHKVRPEPVFADFLRRNADAIIKSDTDEKGRLGPHWQGPSFEADVSSHSSALDCLVAAAAVS